MRLMRFGFLLAISTGFAAAASAQPMLYAQRLPAGTVYMRLVNALPGAASIGTDFAGKVDLGADGAARVSPYFVSTTLGDKTVNLQIAEAGKTMMASFTPKSGSFVTVLLHQAGDKVTAAVVADKPEYNQLRARLAFYNATADCAAGSLAEASGQEIFKAMAPDTGAARAINPVSAKVVAGCTGSKAPALDLGDLQAGGLYTVYMMRPAGSLISFVAHDLIAPPRS